MAQPIVEGKYSGIVKTGDFEYPTMTRKIIASTVARKIPCLPGPPRGRCLFPLRMVSYGQRQSGGSP